MVYIKLLKNKTIAILWFSQLLSAIGDQIYLICACWLAAQTSAGALAVVAAAEYVSAFLFSFVAGILTDRYNRRQLMIYADLGRALAVFSLPCTSAFQQISTWHLALVGVVLGSLGVLFDPCLVSTIPALTEEHELLQATNGLIDFTKRIARVLGPAVAGLCASFIPVQYLFNLDTISFLISAIGIIYVSRQIDLNDRNLSPLIERGGFLDELIAAWGLIKSHTLIFWELFCYFFANLAYAIVYTSGLPLLAKQRFGDNIASYGLLVSIYGIASIIANLFMGSRKLHNFAMTIFLAYMCWGIGFAMLGLAPNIVLAALGLGIAAFSGPVVFITIVTMVQRDIPNKDIGKIYSFRTATMYSGLALGLLLAGYLFAKWQAPTVMPWAASIFFVIGISGILRFYKEIKS